MRPPDVSPETLARWLRLAVGPLALRSLRRRDEATAEAVRRDGGERKHLPELENPLARTPRGGVLMPDARWTRATAREARRGRVLLALGAAGILLGGGALALALRHRERRLATARADPNRAVVSGGPVPEH